MAIEATFSCAYQDLVIDSNGKTTTIADHQKAVEGGSSANIDRRLSAANAELVNTANGVMSFAQAIQDGETITGRVTSTNANLVKDTGAKSLAEYESGNVQVQTQAKNVEVPQTGQVGKIEY